MKGDTLSTNYMCAERRLCPIYLRDVVSLLKYSENTECRQVSRFIDRSIVSRAEKMPRRCLGVLIIQPVGGPLKLSKEGVKHPLRVDVLPEGDGEWAVQCVGQKIFTYEGDEEPIEVLVKIADHKHMAWLTSESYIYLQAIFTNKLSHEGACLWARLIPHLQSTVYLERVSIGFSTAPELESSAEVCINLSLFDGGRLFAKQLRCEKSEAVVNARLPTNESIVKSIHPLVKGYVLYAPGTNFVWHDELYSIGWDFYDFLNLTLVGRRLAEEACVGVYVEDVSRVIEFYKSSEHLDFRCGITALSILVDLGYEDLPWPEALCPIEEAPTPLIKYIEYLSDYKLIYEVSIFNEHSGKEIKATAIEYRKAIDQERIVPRRIIRVILEFM